MTHTPPMSSEIEKILHQMGSQEWLIIGDVPVAQDWLREKLTTLVREAQESMANELHNKVSGYHVKAKKAYSTKEWVAGYHDALFDVERAIAKELPSNIMKR